MAHRASSFRTIATNTICCEHTPLCYHGPVLTTRSEAYLPNRWWRKIEGRWIYTIAGSHERDLELVQRLSKR
jgi:(2Fe-2S) ferredoxin